MLTIPDKSDQRRICPFCLANVPIDEKICRKCGKYIYAKPLQWPKFGEVVVRGRE